MKLKSYLDRVNWFISAQLGLDLKKAFISLLGLPRYLIDLYDFRSRYKGKLEVLPCLHDWYEEGGSIKSEYFWQDLVVAKMICAARPEKHVDVGSRVDGFVAHVASFREIEVFDVRPISTKIPAVTFTQADLMNALEGMADYCDSLSCLHALEHFGLGRYGDPINPAGSEHGLKNLARMLKKDGVLYLSVPIGIERVEFNAHRIFDPRSIVKFALTNSLRLTTLTVFRQGGMIEKLELNDHKLAELAKERYALGIFTFVKTVPT